MNTQTMPMPRFSNRPKVEGDPQPERVDHLGLPEQVTGAVVVRTERTAADILAERLAEADPGSVSLSFVP